MTYNKFLVATIENIDSKIESKRSHYGSFIVSPLEVGQGITVGNALRRVLLGDLEGIAITSVKIPGTTHEFSTISGVREAVLDILLNLKQIVFKANDGSLLEDTIPPKEKQIEKGRIIVQGPTQITANDIQLPSTIEVVDTEQYIATLSNAKSFELEFTLEKGKGYVIPDNEKKKNLEIDILPIDSIFMPVLKVNYIVEDLISAEKKQEKVLIEIWTNGSLTPQQALDCSINKIIQLFQPLQNIKSAEQIPILTETDINMNDVLVEELDLSVRAYNCLKRAQIDTVSDLLAFSQEELLEIKNFGRRSAEEVIEALQKKLGIYLPKDKIKKE
jgi:DNA-directed RNA polymerase subunit alpha